MKHSEQLDKLAAALSKAQSNMQGAKKDTANPFFKSKYADLSSCVDASRAALCAEGLSVIQGNTPADKGVMIQTRIMHSSGQWIEEDGLFVPAAKYDPQGFGSALTYARRYSLCAMVGIAPEDDDGNSATKAVKDAAIIPTGGVFESLSTEDKKAMENMADHISNLIAGDLIIDAVSYLHDFDLTVEQKTGLWSLLNSKERAALKKEMSKQSEAA